jgi:hypothetical protein
MLRILSQLTSGQSKERNITHGWDQVKHILKVDFNRRRQEKYKKIHHVAGFELMQCSQKKDKRLVEPKRRGRKTIQHIDVHRALSSKEDALGTYHVVRKYLYSSVHRMYLSLK